MAFEVFKAKRNARKARKEAINYLDEFIRDKTISLTNIQDIETRKQTEEEIAHLVSMREVMRSKNELPKWACVVIEGIMEFGSAVGIYLLRERAMNMGADKLTTDAIGRVAKH